MLAVGNTLSLALPPRLPARRPLLDRARRGVDPGRREEPQILPEDPVDAAEPSGRIALLEPPFRAPRRLPRNDRPGQGPGQEAVARGMIGALEDLFR